ncbi:Sialidase [Xylariaceae sp. FL0804]|nr:Sialidase [Xylariaceae sp. FL0804]
MLAPIIIPLAGLLALAAALPPSPQLPSTQPPSAGSPPSFFANDVIWQPAGAQSASYPRYAELADGRLLATASASGFFSGNGSDDVAVPAFFPVFASADGGASWTWLSNVTDRANGGWGLDAQPALLQLDRDVGGFAAGAVLAAGNSWSGTATRIDLYVSRDGSAESWEFVGLVAEGGPPNTTNGATPVWEPCMYGDELVCYYSDQRDPLHGQKLAHQTTRDLVRWGPVVDDVAYADYGARPGMAVVAHLPPPIDSYILVHEFPGDPNVTGGQGNASYPVYYRIAASPLEFAAAEGLPIVAAPGAVQPSSSPYVAWSPLGGPNGTIVVSDADHQPVFVNRAMGDVDAWEMMDVPQPIAYSRALHVFDREPDRLMVLGAANYPGVDPPGLIRPLSLSVVDLMEGLEAVGT